MTAHSAIFTATRTQHMELRLSTLDCLSQIETLVLDPDCDDQTREQALEYAANVVEGVSNANPLSADELRAVLDDFDTYFPAN